MHGGYENLNQSSNFSKNQIFDTTTSSINDNEDIIIIKENDNHNHNYNNHNHNNHNNKTNTELAIINEPIDDLGNMKIEKDNFLDNNNIRINDRNQNQINYNNFFEERVINKRRFGKTFPFFFRNGEPMIVIGPHCKIIKYKIK